MVSIDMGTAASGVREPSPDGAPYWYPASRTEVMKNRSAVLGPQDGHHPRGRSSY